MKQSYILLHRQGLTREDWLHPLRTLAWIDLCVTAAFKDHTEDDGVLVRRGEVIGSYRFFAKKWRQPLGTVHRWFSYWIAEHQVERRPERCVERDAERFFLINYDKYQDGKIEPEHRVERAPEHQPEQNRKKVRRNNVLQKETPSAKTTDDEKPVDWQKTKEQFFAACELHGFCDRTYAEKTWEQGSGSKHRKEFVRKVVLLLTWARLPKHKERARVLYGEIAGFVNDKGAMERALSPAEIESRREFREATGQDL